MVLVLDKLERRYGVDMFRQVFKTIMVDIDSEFADVNGLERSILEDEERGRIYITATCIAAGSVAQTR